MKKIGVVTFHRSNSYGACLQAYATVEFLNANSYDSELIDYTNNYEQRFTKAIYKEGSHWSSYITAFIKNWLLGKKYYARKAFGNPEKRYPMSSGRYTSLSQMQDLAYDALVVGSDQVWNRHITDGLDKAFLLQFGNARKRISVSSSLGSVDLLEEELSDFREAFAQFSAISVREEYAKQQLQPLTDKPIKILSDPTFLLSKEDWLTRLAAKSKYHNTKEKYILTFFLAADRTYNERVQQYAKQMGLPVWAIQSTVVKRIQCDKKILGATVEDFIALIANAEVIMTDSFHGAALSLNLEKNFVAFKNKGNPIRVMNLLDTLGLSQRMDMTADNYCAVNYTDVNDLLNPIREDSKQWILDAVEEL